MGGESEGGGEGNDDDDDERGEEEEGEECGKEEREGKRQKNKIRIRRARTNPSRDFLIRYYRVTCRLYFLYLVNRRGRALPIAEGLTRKVTSMLNFLRLALVLVCYYLQDTAFPHVYS